MQYNLLKNHMSLLIKSSLIKNSLWGLTSTVLQTLFLSLVFVLISRHYTTINFANYLIATTIYQLLVGISSMGLGTWFIREFEQELNDRKNLISRFLKIQFFLGLLFYTMSIALIFILYSESEIRLLGIILGANIIFDNVIYALKSLNIAEAKQKKTAIIMVIDAFAKLLVVGLLFFVPFSITVLCILLVAVRVLTLNIFVKIGIQSDFGIRDLWLYKITVADIHDQVIKNWRFIIITGVSIVFWRSATIIISKFLSADDLATYEVAYKILSIFLLIPVIVSSTVFPEFVKLYAKNDYLRMRKLYKIIFSGYTIFSLISYAFIQSFSEEIMIFVFSNKYSLSAGCLQEMFLTFLVFPSVLLQASIIVAMKLEKLDMYFNIVALTLNFAACFIGLHYFKSLSVINYSIFGSFLVFHLIQDILLIRLKIVSITHSIIFYIILAVFVALYNSAIMVLNPAALFFGVITICSIIAIFHFRTYLKINGTSPFQKV